MNFRPALLALIVAALAVPLLPAASARAQGQVEFGGMEHDTSDPVEVVSDTLEVNEEAGTAVFSGDVLVVQGDMRLSAATVRVEYTQQPEGAEADEGAGNEIERLYASGGVTLTSGEDSAEASEAVYTLASGEVVMTGDVLMTQGGNLLSGQKLRLNMETGNGIMEGRVRTTFSPGNGN
ncbi:MAG: LptA/OstA family protein [Celeribacter sp.]|jgi:lipopolysaccharide export system protein LptA